MRRHFGLTVVLAMLVISAGWWAARRAFGENAVDRGTVISAVLLTCLSAIALTRREGARASAWTLITSSLASGSIGWIFAIWDARWFAKVLAVALVSSPLMSLANSALRRDILNSQRRLDALSVATVQRVIDGSNTKPFALYLRPFFTTERLIAQPVPDELSSEAFPVHLDIETLLARSMRRRSPLIALGRQGDIDVGAARVTLDETGWHDIVRKVALHASVIVIIPLARPGTLEELGFLLERGLLTNTIMLMPETVAGASSGVVTTTENDRLFNAGIRRYSGSAHHLDLATAWPEALRAVREIGIELPPLAQVGALFTIDPSTRRVARIAPLGLSALHHRTQYLNEIIPWLGVTSTAGGRSLPEMLEASVTWRGRTLELVYIRAADGYVTWGDLEMARVLVTKAKREGRPHPRITTYYLNALADFAAQSLESNDRSAAGRYLDAAEFFSTDPNLAPLVGDDLRGRLPQLGVSIREPEG